MKLSRQAGKSSPPHPKVARAPKTEEFNNGSLSVAMVVKQIHEKIVPLMIQA